MFHCCMEVGLYQNDKLRLPLELAKIYCYSREFVIFLLGFENVIVSYMWLTDTRECANAEPNVMIQLNGLFTSYWRIRNYPNFNVPWV